MAALLGVSIANAQPAGRGAQTGPALSITQQLTLAREMDLPTALTGAQAAAATALVQASLTFPANPAEITAKANELAAAELALASARADGFARVQKALQPLTADQASTYARGGAGGGGRGGGAATSNWLTAYNDNTGFVSLFDGKTLNGWEAEEGKWDVQDGAIHRHQMVAPVKNFVDFGQLHIFTKEIFADFDLKVEFKIRSGNAGIHYRSRLESALRAKDGEPARVAAAGGRGGGGVAIPLRNVAAAIADPLGKPLPANIKTLDDALNAGLLPRESAPGVPILYGNGTGHPWQVSGYQFDITGAGTGNLYEGQGTRNGGGSVGDIVNLLPGGGRSVLGKVADQPWVQYGKEGDWNQVEIICRGNTLVHMLNGRVILVCIDDNVEFRALKGIISLQLEGPADNEVWYRNIYIKKL